MIKLILSEKLCGKTTLAKNNIKFFDLDKYIKENFRVLGKEELFKRLNEDKIYLLNIHNLIKFLGTEKLKNVKVLCIVLPRDIEFRKKIYIEREKIHKPEWKHYRIDHKKEHLIDIYKKAERVSKGLLIDQYQCPFYYLNNGEFMKDFVERLNIG